MATSDKEKYSYKKEYLPEYMGRNDNLKSFLNAKCEVKVLKVLKVVPNHLLKRLLIFVTHVTKALR